MANTIRFVVIMLIFIFMAGFFNHSHPHHAG